MLDYLQALTPLNLVLLASPILAGMGWHMVHRYSRDAPYLRRLEEFKWPAGPIEMNRTWGPNAKDGLGEHLARLAEGEALLTEAESLPFKTKALRRAIKRLKDRYP